MPNKGINLDDLDLTPATEARASCREEVVEQYAQEKKGGATFPNPVVFHDGEKYYLADGLHRVTADAENNIPKVFADIRKGTWEDAFRFACRANDQHGVATSREDKKSRTQSYLKRNAKLSDRQIAEVCNVSPTYVGQQRRELETKGLLSTVDSRKTKNGKNVSVSTGRKAAKTRKAKQDTPKDSGPKEPEKTPDADGPAGHGGPSSSKKPSGGTSFDPSEWEDDQPLPTRREAEKAVKTQAQEQAAFSKIDGKFQKAFGEMHRALDELNSLWPSPKRRQIGDLEESILKQYEAWKGER